MENTPFFSIIIPTRNRPLLFEKALLSVVEQDFPNKEIIVVNDGSDESYLDRYSQIINNQPISIQWHSLVHRKNGHGQSYSMNFGASMARGEYLCFLDDDDYWIDTGHLKQAYQDITQSESTVDLYYTNQKAIYSNGKQKQEDVWIEDLISEVESDEVSANAVNASFLLQSNGFAHLNCSIFRKDFYFMLEGMDENIRYECDRDIYIRSIDSAENILYQPKFVSLHNIPNNKDSSNMSTLVNDIDKKLYQLRVYEKGILKSKNKNIKKMCFVGKMYLLKFLAESFYRNGKDDVAFIYAKEALAINYTLKWHFFVIYLRFKNMIFKVT